MRLADMTWPEAERLLTPGSMTGHVSEKVDF